METPTFALFIDQSTPQKPTPVVVNTAAVVDDDMLWSLPHKLTLTPPKSPPIAKQPPLFTTRSQKSVVVQTTASVKVHSKTQTDRVSAVSIDTQTPITKWTDAETQTRHRIAVNCHTQTFRPAQVGFLIQVSPTTLSVPTQTELLPQPPPQLSVSTQAGGRPTKCQAVQTTFIDYKQQFLDQKRRADELERQLEQSKLNTHSNPPMIIPMWSQPLAQPMAQPMAQPPMVFPSYYPQWGAPPQFFDHASTRHRKRRLSTCSSYDTPSPTPSHHRSRRRHSPHTPQQRKDSVVFNSPPSAPAENTTYCQDYYTPYPLNEADEDPQLPLSPLDQLVAEPTLASPPRRRTTYPRDEFLFV